MTASNVSAIQAIATTPAAASTPAASLAPRDEVAVRHLQRLMQRDASLPPAPPSHGPVLQVLGHLRVDAVPSALVFVSGDQSWPAPRRAFGCLVALQPGDLVQATISGEQCWITAVLERDPACQGVVLDLEGRDLQIRAGEVRVDAGDGFEVMAPRIDMQAEVLREVVGERHAAVRGASIVSARTHTVDARAHIGLQAPLTTMTAEALIKINAAQIHMG